MKAILAATSIVAILFSVSVAAETGSPAPAALATPAVQPAVVAPSTAAPLIATPRLVATPGASLPANTEIWLSPNAEVNSKRIKQGEKFDMTVARDVMLGDYIVIPRGTKGRGQITYRTGKGAFGKSAKMEFEINEVEVGGRFIPLTGHYRIEGGGNTGATVGTAVAVGPFAAFVTGRSAIVAQGTEYKAFTANPIPIALAAPATQTVPTMPAAAPVTPTADPTTASSATPTT
jgi:hypothetical protein